MLSEATPHLRWGQVSISALLCRDPSLRSGWQSSFGTAPCR